MNAASSPQLDQSPLDALNQLNEVAKKCCESQMLFAACELGVFQRLAKGPARASAIAGDLKLQPDQVRRSEQRTSIGSCLQRRDLAWSESSGCPPQETSSWPEFLTTVTDAPDSSNVRREGFNNGSIAHRRPEGFCPPSD